MKPAFVNDAQRTKLRQRILPNNYPTEGGTPLKESINDQAALLRDFVPAAPLQAGGKRVLVVVTDGAASDCTKKPSCSDIITDVTNLRTATPSVTTFVIGVGEPTAATNSEFNETFLSQLAQAGGAAPNGCNPDWDGQNPVGKECHFQITPGSKSAATIQKEMSDAMDAIAAKVQSCELSLNKTSPIDPAKVNVVYVDGDGNESQVPKDKNAGWSYDNDADPTKVILNGASCETLKADAEAKVNIVIGCPTGTQVR